MEEQFTVRGISVVTTVDHDSGEKEQRNRESRRAAGRYTLGEAAMFISNASGARADSMVKKLMHAAYGGALKVFDPNGETHRYGEGYALRARKYYEEACWDDLNKWLAENEPLLFVAFPDPKASTLPDEAQEQNKAQAKLAEIIGSLELYAKNAGLPFDRQAMPGPLGAGFEDEGSFHWLCGKIDHRFMKAARTFKGYRGGVCALEKYAVPTDFYRKALQHIVQILKSGQEQNHAK